MVKYTLMIFLSLFSLFGCQTKSHRFLRDDNKNLIIPKESYKLYKLQSKSKLIEGKYLEVERNRYKNETELNDMIVFYKDGSVKVYLTDNNGIPKYNRFYTGMYRIENDKVLIEFFYPTRGGSNRYSSIIHEGKFLDDTIILTRFKDIINLKLVK